LSFAARHAFPRNILSRCSCLLFSRLFSLTFGFSEEQHNPALKYAPNGKKIGLPAKSVAGGAAAAAASAAAATTKFPFPPAAASSYPPPDIALCRIFRAQDHSNFAQVSAATPSLRLPNIQLCRCRFRRES
jgi:hypothetical protein